METGSDACLAALLADSTFFLDERDLQSWTEADIEENIVILPILAEACRQSDRDCDRHEIVDETLNSENDGDWLDEDDVSYEYEREEDDETNDRHESHISSSYEGRWELDDEYYVRVPGGLDLANAEDRQIQSAALIQPQLPTGPTGPIQLRQGAEPRSCPICSDALDPRDADQPLTNCECCIEQFHAACLRTWVAEEHSSSRCPCCRQTLSPEFLAMLGGLTA
jgi:hypothetical protein